VPAAPPPAPPPAPAAAPVTRTAPASRPPSAPTRAERRASGSSGRRRRDREARNGEGGGRKRRLIIGGVIAAVLIIGAGAAFALGVFSGDDGGGGSAAPDAETDVAVNIGDVTVEWPGLGPSGIQDGVTDQIQAALETYINDGIAPSLRTGKAKPRQLNAVFTDTAINELAGGDGSARGALFDEGLPPAVGKLTITASAPITALNDNEHRTLAATARVTIVAKGRTDDGRFTITRVGEIAFAPDAAGAWKANGWRILTTRQGKGIPGATDAQDETTDTTTTPEAT